jgi:hypothetical protein
MAQKASLRLLVLFLGFSYVVSTAAVPTTSKAHSRFLMQIIYVDIYAFLCNIIERFICFACLIGSLKSNKEDLLPQVSLSLSLSCVIFKSKNRILPCWWGVLGFAGCNRFDGWRGSVGCRGRIYRRKNGLGNRGLQGTKIKSNP